VTGSTTLRCEDGDLIAVRSALDGAGQDPAAGPEATSVAVLGGAPAEELPPGRWGDVEVFVAVDRPSAGPTVEQLADRFGGLLAGATPVDAAEPYIRLRAASQVVNGVRLTRGLDVTLFDAGRLVAQMSGLREQCLTLGAEALLGDPPGGLLRALHAFHDGQALWGADRLEVLQTRIGSDFYPLLTLLFALDRARLAVRDLSALDDGDPAERADATRRFAQAAADALVAFFGRPVPDEKWRLAGLRRLEAARPDLLRWEEFYDALFPGRDAGPAAGPVADALRTLLRSPLVRTYWQAEQLNQELARK
jgi:hypothetical protein